MEVFIRDVPEQVTENRLRNLLSPFMAGLSIQMFHCQKQREKPFAWLTFLKIEDGQRFLATYGQANAGDHRNLMGVPSKGIKILGTSISCTISNKPANPHLLRSLAREEKGQRSKTTKTPARENATISVTTFSCSSISCGVWTYADSDLVFVPNLTWESRGDAKFGTQSMALTLESGKRIDIPYSSVIGITSEDVPRPSFTFTLFEAPRFYEVNLQSNIVLDPLAAMVRLTINNRNGSQRRRIISLTADHESIAGSCFVYRLILSDSTTARLGLAAEVGNHMRALTKAPGMPPMIHQRTNIGRSRRAYAGEQKRLTDSLTRMASSPLLPLPWKLCFQIRRLVTNAYLTPTTVLDMLPEIEEMMRRSGLIHAMNAIQKIFHQIPFAGPDTEAEQLELGTLVKLLRTNEEQSKRGELGEDEKVSRRTDSGNFAMIHRAMVTPAGIYLYGPDPEPMNRVLRKYALRHEYFLRMEFTDEDGQPVRFNPRVSNDAIFQERFKSVLERGFSISGRKYDFLGFSHSSLRSQACWFMAPFTHNGSLLFDRMLIKELGDFSKIRCPAKCAARIGQAFSETPTVITLAPGVVRAMNDVKRNGRVFSDGVGTISRSIMHKIWEALPKIRNLKPTCFQIRFQGAKGMLSLDSRLKGDCVFLRPSMIKFEGSNSMDVELCGASYKPLPMYLNRQTIKILEDMGVEDRWFLTLQATEVERLRKITESPSNASNFLSSQSIGEEVYLPWLIKKLQSLGLDFREDRFLWDVLQMSVMMELRVLKHRARIPVKKGLTLYGIMDETGILEEGQIFCIFDGDNAKKRILIEKDLIITRSPALHPGDIQLVDAVTVPSGSPLLSLSNCICFSQKGKRDLPSQLSGGDLDGDLYNIIWDHDAHPKHTFSPADYPRQDPEDIGRTVERKDMTDFFVKFMETDQLGRIATTHQVLADQKPLGTCDPDCTLLAEMHSTAVDFSKTGVPVVMSRMPKFIPVRPDFMAPGPHVKIEKKEGLLLEESSSISPDNNNDDDDFTPYRYYESDKILGQLYRAIDEHEIFAEIKRHRRLESGSSSTVLNKVWAYAQRKCQLYKWKEHIPWARDIRDMYEDCLLNIMTTYSEHPLRPISEIEAFIGNILGATGVQSKKQRDLSITMKERFGHDATFIMTCIKSESPDQKEAPNNGDALERSMACLAVSLEDRTIGGSFKKGDQLLSFRYIAAAVCLKEMEFLV